MIKLVFIIICTSFLIIIHATLYALAQEKKIISPEFQNVTCHSTIKLQHVASNFFLHSHAISYGTGSGQQSITGYKEGDDPNSYFVVQEAVGEPYCYRGTMIRCNSIISLKHSETKKYLHSHHFESPISHQKEISCFDGSDTGNNWKIECVDSADSSAVSSSNNYWSRDKLVRLKHIDTDTYLSADENIKFPTKPVQGQLEIFGADLPSKNTLWSAKEGIYFSSNRMDL